MSIVIILNVFLHLVPSMSFNTTLNISGFEVWELDEMTPFEGLTLPLPTGVLSLEQVGVLNMPVWAVNVTTSTIDVIAGFGYLSSDVLSEVSSSIAQLVDVDLHVHCCLVTELGNCTIDLTSTEDHNRYIDLFVHAVEENLGLRVVVAEDAALAVNQPLSFNVNIVSCKANGQAELTGVVGKNLLPDTAGAALDQASLQFANRSLVDAVVSTTQTAPWEECSKRSAKPYDFQSALTTAVTDLLASVPGTWGVDFNVPMTSDTGIAMDFTYSLCGHLMIIPLVVQRSAAAELV